MFDRAEFWPATPDWNAARIETNRVSVVASRGNLTTFILSGSTESFAAIARNQACTLLKLAPDRFLLTASQPIEMPEGWHAEGFALSAADDLYVRLDISGQDANELLSSGSMSIAMMRESRSPGVLSFAGITVVFEPREDGARLHVEHPQATYLWHWLIDAISREDTERL